jgi:nitrate reductase NapE component
VSIESVISKSKRSFDSAAADYVSAEQRALKKLLSFVFSVCLVTALVFLLWMFDVVRQAPDIPPQNLEGNFDVF